MIDLDAMLPVNCRIVIKPTDDGYDKVTDVLAAEDRRQIDKHDPFTFDDDGVASNGDLPF
jgi:hypothetical protein